MCSIIKSSLTSFIKCIVLCMYNGLRVAGCWCTFISFRRETVFCWYFRIVNIKIEAQKYIQDSTYFYRTLSLNIIVMGLHEQEPYSITLASYCGLCKRGYLDLTKHSTKVKFFFFFVWIQVTLSRGVSWLHMRNVVSNSNDLAVVKNDSTNNGLEFHGTTLCSIENMPQMQRSMKNVPKSTSTVKLLTTPKQPPTQRSLIPTNVGRIQSVWTACFVAVCKLRWSADLIWSCHNHVKNDVLLKVTPELVSSKLDTVRIEFDRIPMEIQMQCVGPWKRGPLSSGSLSYETLTAYEAFD